MQSNIVLLQLAKLWTLTFNGFLLACEKLKLNNSNNCNNNTNNNCNIKKFCNKNVKLIELNKNEKKKKKERKKEERMKKQEEEEEDNN